MADKTPKKPEKKLWMRMLVLAMAFIMLIGYIIMILT